MTAQIEARRISGADLDKHVEGEDRISSDAFAGTIIGVSHRSSEGSLPLYIQLFVRTGPGRIVRAYLHPIDQVTITGKEST